MCRLELRFLFFRHSERLTVGEHKTQITWNPGQKHLVGKLNSGKQKIFWRGSTKLCDISTHIDVFKFGVRSDLDPPVRPGHPEGAEGGAGEEASRVLTRHPLRVAQDHHLRDVAPVHGVPDHHLQYSAEPCRIRTAMLSLAGPSPNWMVAELHAIQNGWKSLQLRMASF